MADQFTYAELPSDPCLTQEQMLAYIDGKLSAADQHACEKHIADCNLCEDALEGLTLVKDRSVLATPLKTAPTTEEPKVIPLRAAGENRKIWFAAAAVLVIMLTSVFFMQQFAESDAALAENQSADTFKSAEAAPPSPIAAGDSVLASHLEQDPTIAKNDRVLSEKSAEAVDGPVMNAPKSIVNEVEEAPVQPEVAMEMDEVIFDFGDDGDKEAKDLSKLEQTATEGDQELKEEDYREEESEKVTFWDRTKAAIPQGNAGAGADKQKLVVTENKKADDRNNQKPADVPASPQTTATGTPDVFAETQNDSVTASGGINLELSYQNGMNLLNAGQANAAIAMFDEVLLDKNHARYEDAEFQKANALIKANRKPEAKILLQAIEAKKGKYAAEATALLKTL